MKNGLTKIILSFSIIVILISLTGCGPRGNMTIAEKRQVIMDMEKETLARLYREAPETKEKISKAAGYGTFSNANVNVILISAGGGYGSVVDNSTGKRTYMKMALGGVGLGLGAKDYRVVMIFNDKATLNKFLESGWDFGAHADAAAKAGETGGELSGEGDIISGIEVFSMTESGLALQATVAGTKYWKDDKLN
jgi:lipid-binding SYLF domain-containing protein